MNTENYELIVSDLYAREAARRKAFLDSANPESKEASLSLMLKVWEADQNHPVGPDVLKFSDIKPSDEFSDLPEPWATRLFLWEADKDWEKFVYEWDYLYENYMDYHLDSRWSERLHQLVDAQQALSGSNSWFAENSCAAQHWASDRIFSDVKDQIDDFELWKVTTTNPWIINPISVDLDLRERLRLEAIEDLEIPDLRDEAIATLNRVRQADKEYPLGMSASLSASDVRSRLNPISISEVVDLIGDPWLERMFKWSANPNFVDVSSLNEWNEFLDGWVENEDRINRILDEPGYELTDRIESAERMKKITLREANIIQLALDSSDGEAQERTSHVTAAVIYRLELHGLKCEGPAPDHRGDVPDFWTVFTVVDRDLASAAIQSFRAPASPIVFNLTPIDRALHYICPSCGGAEVSFSDGDSLHVPVLPLGVSSYGEIDPFLIAGECSCGQPLYAFKFGFSTVSYPEHKDYFCAGDTKEKYEHQQMFKAEAEGFTPWLVKRHWYSSSWRQKVPYKVDIHYWGPFKLDHEGELSGEHGVSRCGPTGASGKWAVGSELFRNLAGHAMKALKERG